MRVVGVIAEYNPFHLGHAYHLAQARQLANADAIVVVMSSVFTQRGDAALLSPADRARMALSAGADAVFALPAAWAVRDAEHFALGGISILTGLGCDAISFGTESTDLSALQTAARLLEAFSQVVKVYPDATLSVTGRNYSASGLRGKLRQGSYEKYLAALTKKYGLEERITFLGSLSAEKMKQTFLDANVFVLPSTMENSPNVLGEAMVLGVPSVAADVGGVRNLMNHGEEGVVYASGDVPALAEGIIRLFTLEDQAAVLGENARSHALKTHDPEKNLRDLIGIYQEIC